MGSPGSYDSGQFVPSATPGQFEAGEMVLDGAGNVSATVDVSVPSPGGLSPNQSLTGSYAISSNGRGTMSFSESGITVNDVFYVISPTKWVRLPTDATATYPALLLAEE